MRRIILIAAATSLLAACSTAAITKESEGVTFFYVFEDDEGDRFHVCKDHDGWVVYYRPSGQQWAWGLGYTLDAVREGHALGTRAVGSIPRPWGRSCP